MILRSAILVGLIGAGALALGLPAHAQDRPGEPPALGLKSKKSVRLVRRAPTVGDAFHAELVTKMEHATGSSKDAVTTRSGYASRILEQTVKGRFVVRLDLDAEESIAIEGSAAPVTSRTDGRTMTLELSEDETRVLPTKGMAAATGGDVLVGRAEVSAGETWTTNKKLPVAGVLEVPVTTTYKVASIATDEKGREVVRIELEGDGFGAVPAAKVRMRVIARGYALVDAARADRPIEVRLTYRFIAEGGEGPDEETRSEIHLKTTEGAAAARPGKESGQ